MPVRAHGDTATGTGHTPATTHTPGPPATTHTPGPLCTTPGPVPGLAAMARSVLRLARLLERTEAPLTPAQYRLAAHIRAGDARATRLACALALSKPTVTQSVEGLVAAGYLRREEVDGDRRASRLVLTGRGEQALAETEAAYAGRLAGLLCPDGGPALPAAMLHQLVDALGLVDDLLDDRLAAAVGAPAGVR